MTPLVAVGETDRQGAALTSPGELVVTNLSPHISHGAPVQRVPLQLPLQLLPLAGQLQAAAQVASLAVVLHLKHQGAGCGGGLAEALQNGKCGTLQMKGGRLTADALCAQAADVGVTLVVQLPIQGVVTEVGQLLSHGKIWTRAISLCCFARRQIDREHERRHFPVLSLRAQRRGSPHAGRFGKVAPQASLLQVGALEREAPVRPSGDQLDVSRRRDRSGRRSSEAASAVAGREMRAPIRVLGVAAFAQRGAVRLRGGGGGGGGRGGGGVERLGMKEALL